MQIDIDIEDDEDARQPLLGCHGSRILRQPDANSGSSDCGQGRLCLPPDVTTEVTSVASEMQSTNHMQHISSSESDTADKSTVDPAQPTHYAPTNSAGYQADNSPSCGKEEDEATRETSGGTDENEENESSAEDAQPPNSKGIRGKNIISEYCKEITRSVAFYADETSQ